jgi:predicted permease
LWSLVQLAPSNLPRLNEVGIGVTVLGFNTAITLGSALLFGLAPALKRVTPAMLGALIQSGTRSSASRGRLLIRHGLVVAQTALALVLLIGSALLVRSFWEIRNVDPGFDPEGVLTFSLSLPPGEFREATVAAAFHQDLLDRINGLPGVISAGAVQSLPLGRSRRAASFVVEEGPLADSEMAPQFWFTSVTPGYFESMRIPLVAGRTLERRDNESGLGSVVVSVSMAEHLWPNGDPLGKRIRVTGDETPWFTVIGVVGDAKSHGLRLAPPETLYLPTVGPGATGPSTRTLTYTVRAENPLGLVQAIRVAVGELDPDLPIARVELMERIVARSEARLSFTMLALAVAAGMSLLLGAIGLYGVLSYVVSQRIHEIGVRLTLGADASVVKTMLVIQGAKLALLGIGIGVAGAVGLTRFLQGLLFGTEHLDPAAFVTTSALLLVVALLASYVPAIRAARVDPMTSLRTE